MLKSKILGGFAVAALMAGIVAMTAANGAELASPDEQAATADLNKKIADDNAALDASEKAKQEAYEQQVNQQQAQYEQRKAEYQRQLDEQKVAYERQLEEQKAAYQRQLEEHQQQVKNAAISQAPSPVR